MKDRNLLPECNEQKLVSDNDFRKLFCARCRNSDCVFSEGGENRWVNRMATQEERFLDNPLFAEPDDPRFTEIRALHFEEALERAYQMELSDQCGDWSIPEVTGPRGEPQTTEKVDFAVRRLAESQGKNPPELPEPQPEKAPPNFLPPSRVVPEPRTQEPTPPPQRPRVPLNTEMPPQGIMVDGTDPHPPSPIHDAVTASWEIPAEQTVDVGGKVTLGPPVEVDKK